ncbi:metallophosphoesterase family protein [Legionella cardiaca]|uniref:Metallophosphoesterase n=1 Tax=Legionella cardiaca TaxID=1071983 RepID=A0ABY8ATT7_9GAMM|nr:metallophosphoesterase [Legionella cardiaca]WED43973.1 metallophosphoesterase [Legionella cardiaca]
MKIAHISDLHFGMHGPQVLEAFLKDVNLLQPEIIIISGDLTQRAKSYQFKLLQSFLNRLPGTVLLVPGNHDVPLYNLVARLLWPLKSYNQYVGEHFKSKFTNNDISILGVSSVNPFKAIEGKLTTSTLYNIEHFFLEANKSVNILFFHHNFDHIEGLHRPLQNEDQFLNYLQTSNIDIVCTGHLHYANLGLIKKKNDRTCLVLHAGSLSCTRTRDGRNSYFLINLHSEKCSVDWRVFEGTQFEFHKNYTVMFADKEVKLE